MITEQEIAAVAQRFGVATAQVERDHLISHVLAALARADVPFVFFGGTALRRTWCLDLRLSEDIDLLVAGPAVVEPVQRLVSRQLRREFPEAEWIDGGRRHDVSTTTIGSWAPSISPRRDARLRAPAHPGAVRELATRVRGSHRHSGS